MTDQEQCTRLFVLIVEKNVKSHSNLHKEGRSTAKRVGKNIDHQEESIDDIRVRFLRHPVESVVMRFFLFIYFISFLIAFQSL